MNKIYILTPDHYETGGVEALYQLADAINSLGGNAITIFDNSQNNPIPNRYKNYNIKYEDYNMIDYNINNTLVVPEVWTDRFINKNINRCIWWLSVDNNHNKFNEFLDEGILNLYQSNYALFHLVEKGTIQYMPLYDYINIIDKFNYDVKSKKNIVCYNPAKGIDITNKIISNNKDIQFVPLIGMSEIQVVDALKSSKVYIDFGNHPGKDRIPREAALAGNCIISSRSGSAKYFNDMPILDKYKMNNIDNIGKIINDCFLKFDENNSNFNLYRSNIKNEKEEFFNQVKKIFKL
jgi:hypothetical protein